MRMKRGSIVAFNTEKIKAVIGKIALPVFADTTGEGEGEPDGGDKTPPVNYEDLISKARKEEKDKQYKTIERLKTQITTLTEQHNNDLLKVADLEKKLEESNKKLTATGSGDSEEIKTLKSTIKTLEGEKSDLSKKVEDYEKNKPKSREEIEKEVRAELEKEYEVKTYKAQKMAELKDKLLVPELVGGETKEDIDASIEAALARSEEIRKSLGITENDSDEDETTPTKKQTKRTPKNPANPSGAFGGKEVSLEKLATMDVRSKEYAELRKQLGLK